MQPVWPHILKHYNFEEAQEYRKRGARIPIGLLNMRELNEGSIPIKMADSGGYGG